MKTEIITENIERAAEIIRAGGLVGVPTETVYGLAANGLGSDAVKKIYEVKGRPKVKALSLMVPGAEAIERYCEDVPPVARELAAKYWPGPLTLILLAKRRVVPRIVRAGGKTVGLRCPDHPLTLELLKKADLPLAAPSANPSGEPSPKDAQQVSGYFDGKIDAIIDGGKCGIGTESTILDLSKTPYRILREAAVSAAEIGAFFRERVTLIGITGGTGCGKSTALRCLKEKGALIIDCDAVYHRLTDTSAEMRAEIEARFGAVYVNDKLDRKALGSIVFSDSAALADLSAITHKYVDAEIEQTLTEFALGGGTLAAIDAIALLENRYADKTLCNVAITAPVEQRVERLMVRDGITEDYARARIAAQKPNKYFEENCNYTLCNDGTKAEFERKCTEFFTEVLKHGCK